MHQEKEAPTGVSAPVLDDFGYVAPTAKKDGPTGVSAPVLDDMASYNSGVEKKGAPTGVSAPVLDDNIPYVSEKKGAPTGVTAPVLDDASVPYTQEKLVLSDEDIIGGLTPELKARFDALPADKQQQIIDMRRTQLGAVAPPVQVTAPVLDEDNYTPPPKAEEPVQPEAPISAPILDDEPEPPKYQPKYVDEDLERAKAEASKKAVSSQLVSEQKDSKESLRMMLELKEEARRREKHITCYASLRNNTDIPRTSNDPAAQWQNVARSSALRCRTRRYCRMLLHALRKRGRRKFLQQEQRAP